MFVDFLAWVSNVFVCCFGFLLVGVFPGGRGINQQISD